MAYTSSWRFAESTKPEERAAQQAQLAASATLPFVRNTSAPTSADAAQPQVRFERARPIAGLAVSARAAGAATTGAASNTCSSVTLPSMQQREGASLDAFSSDQVPTALVAMPGTAPQERRADWRMLLKRKRQQHAQTQGPLALHGTSAPTLVPAAGPALVQQGNALAADTMPHSSVASQQAITASRPTQSSPRVQNVETGNVDDILGMLLGDDA